MSNLNTNEQKVLKLFSSSSLKNDKGSFIFESSIAFHTDIEIHSIPEVIDSLLSKELIIKESIGIEDDFMGVTKIRKYDIYFLNTNTEQEELSHSDYVKTLNLLRIERPKFSLNNFVNLDELSAINDFWDRDFNCEEAIDFLLLFEDQTWKTIVESGLFSIDAVGFFLKRCGIIE